MASSLELEGSQISLLKDLSPCRRGPRTQLGRTHVTGDRGFRVQRRQKVLAPVPAGHALRANSSSKVWKVLPSFGVDVGAAENLEEDQVENLHTRARYRHPLRERSPL